MEEVFHGANTQDYHFSVSGGNNTSDFYLSSGYYRQDAIIGNMEMNRYSFKVGSDHNIGHRLKFSENVSFAFLDMKGLKEGCFLNDYNNPILGAMQMLPIYARDTVPWGMWMSDKYNYPPTNNIELSNNSRKNYSLFSNLSTEIKLFKGLTYSTRFGLELYFQDNISFIQPEYIIPKEYAVEGIYNIRDLSFDWSHGLEYSAIIAGHHSLNAGIYFEFGHIDHEWIPIDRITFDTSMHPVANIETELENPSGTEFFHQAWSGHFEYAYREKYLLSFNIRREKIGYYDLQKEFQNLEQIYPSISAGWIWRRGDINPLSWISFGKLRFGLGKAGISPRLNYSFFADMIRETQYFYALSDDVSKLRSPYSRSTNESLFWEQLNGVNSGIDIGFFENKLFITVDYFTDLLHSGTLYAISKPKNIISQLEDIGSFGCEYHKSAGTKNSGVEAEISYRMNRRDLNFECSINLSHVKNEIVDIRKADIQMSHNIISVNLPGEAAGSFYGYKIERLFQILLKTLF